MIVQTIHQIKGYWGWRLNQKHLKEEESCGVRQKKYREEVKEATRVVVRNLRERERSEEAWGIEGWYFTRVCKVFLLVKWVRMQVKICTFVPIMKLNYLTQ